MNRCDQCGAIPSQTSVVLTPRLAARYGMDATFGPNDVINFKVCGGCLDEFADAIERRWARSRAQEEKAS